MTPVGTIDTTLLTPTTFSSWSGGGISNGPTGGVDTGAVDALGESDRFDTIDTTFAFSPGTDESSLINPGGPFSRRDYTPSSTVTQPFATYSGNITDFRAGFSVRASDLVDSVWTADGQWTFAVGSTFDSIGLEPGEYTIEDAVTGEGFTIFIGGV